VPTTKIGGGRAEKIDQPSDEGLEGRTLGLLSSLQPGQCPYQHGLFPLQSVPSKQIRPQVGQEHQTVSGETFSPFSAAFRIRGEQDSVSTLVEEGLLILRRQASHIH
jgi:hypothetical protein